MKERPSLRPTPAVTDLSLRKVYADLSFSKRYPILRRYFGAHAANRIGMLLHLRHHPELQDRLIFGTDYPLSVFHLAAWGRVGLRGARKMVRTTNRFDRQVAVCQGLGLTFRSFNG